LKHEGLNFVLCKNITIERRNETFIDSPTLARDYASKRVYSIFIQCALRFFPGRALDRFD